jgi:exonuclease SbcD
MKILHTSDWHLGQRFINQERGEEHARALDWLLQTLCREQVDALIVAGDVFDTGSPPQSALRQYYDFLTRLTRECPAQVIITGGNHDSPALLDAPGGLLETLRVRVVGSAGGLDTRHREIVELRDPGGRLRGAVAAVPFLRDRDLKYALAGETADQRDASLREGIAAHYRAIAEAMRGYAEQDLPLIATGHLYAAGAALSDSERDIHLGNLGRVTAEAFPPAFAYVALGHLHRAQRVAGREHVRYSGSLLPLGFAEADTAKSVSLVEFDGPRLKSVGELPVPSSRPLLRLRGNLAQVLETIAAYQGGEHEFPAWAEVNLTLAAGETGSAYPPDVDKTLRAAAEGRHLEILKVVLQRPESAWSEELPRDLESLEPLEVFRQLCRDSGGDFAGLKDDFSALLSLVQEQQDENTQYRHS